jgi:chemotaxis regulatin CheY-phosphate phosphatase CheZ
MTDRGSLPSISDADYDAIEDAVMETARGRWFLAEFARRNRTADTQVLLEAIGRLESAVVAERSAQELDRLRFDLREMAKAISLTKTEIAAIHPADHPYSHLVVASEALDAIARTTERATSDILDSAEHIQEAAWTLREDGANAALCDELDRRATEIYTACSFQDLTAQRTSRVVQTLRYLEGRINAMIDIWGGTPDIGHQAASMPAMAAAEMGRGHGDLSQSDVDSVIVGGLVAGPGLRPDAQFTLSPPVTIDGTPLPADDLAFVEAAEWSMPILDTLAPAAEAPKPQERAPIRIEAFAEIDALDPKEKLRRFT